MSYNFSSPASAPANSSLTGGFSFGANKPATPGFGLTGASQPSGVFGTPATSAPAFGTATPAFGAGNTPAFGGTPAFGATSATPAFGTGTPAFGAASTAPSFGAGATPAFGATSTAPNFGGTSTSAFGATGAPAFGATSVAPTFGATTTPAFGTTGTGAFGGTGLGTGGLNFGTGSNTSSAATGLTLGAPAATSTGLGGLGGFGFASNATQSTGLGGNFFATTTASNTLFGPKLGTTTVTGTQPSASAAPSLGLGGIAPIGAATTTTGSDKAEPPKQIKLPNEILTTVDSFKDFVKKQKSLSSELMRVSIKPLYKVSRSADSTLRVALCMRGEVWRARSHSRRLRAAAAAALATAEAVDNVPVTELEGTAPPGYVKDLISELEQQLITFRRQMDVADKQMQSAPKLLTEQELTLGIRRMHESLVALAGRLQAVHSQVEEQKEQYLNLRKYVLKDPTNVFDMPDTTLDQILRDAEGTKKKVKNSRLSGSYTGSAVLADPRAALGNMEQLAGPSPFTYISNTLSQFPNQDVSVNCWQPTAAGTATATENTFQLQKPPGKRGKQ